MKTRCNISRNSSQINLQYMVKMLVFDMDGTLTPSRLEIRPEMADTLIRTLEHFRVAILTGGGIDNIQKQILQHVPEERDYSKMYLAPNSGTSLYVHSEQKWQNVYMLEIPQKLREYVMSVCYEAMQTLHLMPEKIYGNLVRDDQTQVSLSLLGNEAPADMRKNIDPDRRKRERLVAYLRQHIPECEYKIAGGNTIDITLAGVDKYS